jgi:superfamily II DNA or RNA helicase
MPTGTGKTVVLGEMNRRIVEDGGRVLNVAHRRRLIEQIHGTIEKQFGVPCEIEMGTNWAATQAFGSVVASVQSVSNPERLLRFSPYDFSHIFIDEAHHSCSDMYLAILNHFSGASVCGVTATPFRSDRKQLSHVFQKISYEYKLVDARNEGDICDIVAETIPIKIDLTNVHIKNGDFDIEETAHAIEPYLDAVADEMVKRVHDRRIMAFLPLIKTSQHMTEILNSKGFAAAHVDGESKDIEQNVRAFERNEINVLCNAMLFSEGTDIPCIDCVVPLRPTRSVVLFMQQCGRGTRLYPGKKNLLILDHLWLTRDVGLCHPASLIAPTQEISDEATKIASQKPGGSIFEEVEEAEVHIANERERALARYLDANKKRKPGTIDPLAFGSLVKDKEILLFEAESQWQKQPATPDQIEILARSGLDSDNITRGYAATIIKTLGSRGKGGLATPKQLIKLKQFGVRSPDKLSAEQASEIIGSRLAGFRRR